MGLVNYSCGIRTDASLWCWGNSVASPTPVGRQISWASVAVGRGFMCGVAVGSSLWCWGHGGNGELGLGGRVDAKKPTRVGADADWASVSTGMAHTCATRLEGSLWCWGADGEGQLGLGKHGVGDTRVPNQVGAGLDWAYVAAGWENTCATRDDHTMWCWGQNSSGETGIGHSGGKVYEPTSIGAATTWTTVVTAYRHSGGTSRNGAAWGWGLNVHGQLGDGSTIERSMPVRVHG